MPDDAAGQDRAQTPDEQTEDPHAGGASAQESAAVATAEKPATPQTSPADRNEDKPVESSAKRGAAKSAKSKGKVARANLSTDGRSPALEQSAKPRTNQSTEKQVAASTAVESPPEQGAVDEARATGDRLRIDLSADPAQTDDASSNSGANVVASGANQPRVSTDAAAIDNVGDVTVTVAVQVANAEKAEPPNGGKRGRGAKAAAINDATSAQNETAANSLEPNAAAADVAAANAAADLVATVDTSADKDTALNDATASGSNDSAEPRPGAVSTALAARQERLHESSGRSEGLTETERVRFVQRVARAFHSMGDEGGEVRLRLSPPELGSLRLEISVREGMLSARLETETASARNLLLDNLPALRERLAEQNIKVERFEVDVRDEQRQPSREHLPGQPDLPGQGQPERYRGPETRRAPAIAQVTPRGPMRNDNTGELNIVI